MLPDEELWDSLPEELEPLHIEYKKIEYLAWKSIDYDKLAKQKEKTKRKKNNKQREQPQIQVPRWPSFLGTPPDTADFNRIFKEIIAIPTVDRIYEHLNIVKILYDVGDLTKIENKNFIEIRGSLDKFKDLDEDAKDKHIMEKRLEFMSLQMKFLFHPTAKLEINSWPKEFGDAPVDFSSYKKLPIVRGSLFHRLKAKESSMNKYKKEIKKASRNLETICDDGETNTTSTEGRVQKVGRYLVNHPGEQKHAINDQLGVCYLSWNVADFQALLQHDNWWNKNTMSSFINSVKMEFQNSMFDVEKDDLMTATDIQGILGEGSLLKERTEHFKDKTKVCRLLVAGQDDTAAHYQVLIMDKTKRELVFIEHSRESDIAEDQTQRIRSALDSIGWTDDYDEEVKIIEFPPKGKKKTYTKNTKNKEKVWNLKHIMHYNPYALKESKECGDINRDFFTQPDCGAFSYLVYLKCMSATDKQFDPKKFTFDADGPESIGIDPEGYRWDAIKKFRERAIPYIKETYEMLKAGLIAHGFFEYHLEKRMRYTFQLLSLSEDNFSAVIMSKEGKKCFCSNRLRNTQNYIMPSCCFRAYHVDCYLRFLWSQFKLKKKHRSFCIDCKQTSKECRNDDVIIGVLDPETLDLVEMYEIMEDDNKRLFEIFDKLSKFDVEHR